MAHIWALAFATGARRAREQQEQREEELKKFQIQKEEEERQRQILVNKFSQKYHPSNTEPLSPELIHFKKVQRPAEYVWHEGKLYTTEQLAEMFQSFTNLQSQQFLENQEEYDEEFKQQAYTSLQGMLEIHGFQNQEGQDLFQGEFDPETHQQYLAYQQQLQENQQQYYDEEEEDEDDEEDEEDQYIDDGDNNDDDDDNDDNDNDNNNNDQNRQNRQNQQIFLQSINQSNQNNPNFVHEETFIDDQQSTLNTLNTLDQSNQIKSNNNTQNNINRSTSILANIDNNFEITETDYQQTIEEENTAQKPQMSVIKSSYKKQGH